MQQDYKKHFNDNINYSFLDLFNPYVDALQKEYVELNRQIKFSRKIEAIKNRVARNEEILKLILLEQDRCYKCVEKNIPYVPYPGGPLIDRILLTLESNKQNIKEFHISYSSSKNKSPLGYKTDLMKLRRFYDSVIISLGEYSIHCLKENLLPHPEIDNMVNNLIPEYENVVRSLSILIDEIKISHEE